MGNYNSSDTHAYCETEEGTFNLYFMKQLELNKMGLDPISEIEMKEIEGGGFWDIYETIGFVVGTIVGTTLKITNDVAKKLLEHAVIK